MRRILVIGNGFDLAHNLPTTYVHFLAFCCALAKLEFDSIKKDEVKSVVDRFCLKYKENQSYVNNFISTIRNNRWVIYFLKKYPKMENGWINFEKEIENVCLDSLNLAANLQYTPLCDANRRRYDMNIVKSDFKNLINLLSEYFEIIDEIAPIKYIKEIIDFLPNNIISFNYTNLLENIYRLADVDHIHGNIKDKNIILGFNSTGSDESDKNYVEFLKYSQKAINNIKPPRYEQFKDDAMLTVFFGHSLDSTDYETIKKIISSSKKVLILYHNMDAKKSYISNLIGMLGKDEFDKKVNSSSKRIFFRETEKVVGLENDIPKYLDIIDFLKKTIKADDKEYILNFYSEKVSKNNDLKEFMLYDLADKLINLWHDFRWPRNECENMCSDLIKKLNALLNQKKYFTTSNTVKIMISDIEYNIKQLN